MTEHKKDENCVFCKIIANEIPSFKVYEDENFFGFLTIKPHNEGHTLLVPKSHIEDIVVADNETAEGLFKAGKKLAEKMQDIFNPRKMSFVIAGLEVNHLHLHLIPMNDEYDLSPDKAEDMSMEKLADVQKLFQ